MGQDIENTKRAFEQSFLEPSFYNRQTQDGQHLKMLLELSSPACGDTILDLGTGSGYVAFALAEQNPSCTVIGLDIVPETMKRNMGKAQEYAYQNLTFAVYDGTAIPFPDNRVDQVVTRYALHHFPDPAANLREVHRVLKTGGRIMISDPTPNQNDTAGFVDEYMRIKPDGHVKFYSFAELDEMLVTTGFRLVKKEMSSICFPRKNPSDYLHLRKADTAEVWEGYRIHFTRDEIWITEDVLNLVYEKI